jgi:CheY-like chemotaxis protein/ketosteroid isomerase-like protein
VDDEELVGRALAEMLKFLGYEPTVCTTADQALNLTKVHPFDLIFSDIRMPGTDGIAFYRFLSVVNKSLAQRLIFVTGDMANPETRDMVRRTGVVCLEKPVHFEELERAIARRLAEARWGKSTSNSEPSTQSADPRQTAQLDGPAAALDQIEKEWNQALSKGDTETLDRLLADDFVATHQTATIWHKADYLVALKKRAHSPTSMRTEEVQVRIHGDCGIVTALVSVNGADQKDSAQYRVTRTWMRQSGKWRCLASHASLTKLSVNVKNTCPFDAQFPEMSIRCT